MPPSSAVEPPAKKPCKELTGWLEKGEKNEESLRDVTRAFAASNVPFSKLQNGSPTRKLFEKYMLVDGEKPRLVDPINFRGTWLQNLMKEGTEKLATVFRKGDWFVVVGAGEKADPRPSNDCIVGVQGTSPFSSVAISILSGVVDSKIKDRRGPTGGGIIPLGFRISKTSQS